MASKPGQRFVDSGPWNTTRPSALLFLALSCAALCPTHAAAQPSSVVSSPHNLSAGGPGPVRATTENEVCIFCHAPHNSSPVQPLWNRVIPTEAYSIYASRSLEAQPGQPTGMSKMCLSCHDGTIALGNVVSQGMPIAMSGGVTTIPAGSGLIGTDLRDDHPISFRYDASLAAKSPKVKDPSLLPREIHLDSNHELQCTSCHDAHNNTLGNFLVLRNDSSQLCLSCHQVGTTTISAHGNCAACHQPHSAPSGPYLLKARNATQTCIKCHDGTHTGASDISSDLRKVSAHDTDSPVDPSGKAAEYASCTSCHEPHTMGTGQALAPRAHPNMGRGPGMSVTGALVASITNEYEACFRCHAEGGKVQPPISRVIVQNNTRLQFAQGAISYHPITTTGRNLNVPSLKPGLTTSTMMYCSDCHASDSGPAAGGGGPGGVHGSNNTALLALNYDTSDFTHESDHAYAMCYKCHDRTSILADQSFPHRKHVVDASTPCSACHDGHGISMVQGNARNNAHLINFDRTIVRADPTTGRLEYQSTGMFSGQCTTSCHGVTHVGTSYRR
jgi:predicted CXXCH cytochrome family protein